jgi:hypothetical protein
MPFSKFYASALGCTSWMVLLSCVLGVFPGALGPSGAFVVTQWGLLSSWLNLAFATFVNARSIHTQSVNILEKYQSTTETATVGEIYPIATFMTSFTISVVVAILNAIIHRRLTCRIINDVIDTKNFVKALNGRCVFFCFTKRGSF